MLSTSYPLVGSAGNDLGNGTESIILVTDALPFSWVITSLLTQS